MKEVMKRLFLFVLSAMALLTACSDSEQIESAVPNQVAQTTSSIRSYDEALQIAKSSVSFLENNATTRAASSREIDMSKNKVVKLDPKTRTATDANDTLMYVFNFADDQGFAVVSASKNTDELLVVTEKGTYNPDSLSGIEGFDLFMEAARRYIENAKVTGKPQRSPSRPLIRDSIGYRPGYIVGPYITVNWGQIYPEGENCPNGVCGCTNTAIAQLMSFYEYPSSISLTYLEQSTYTQLLNWSQMKAHQTGHNKYNCTIPNIHLMISKLLRELGHLNQSNYDMYWNVTGTNRDVVPNNMTQLGYQTSSWISYNFSVIKNNLDTDRLCLISGGDVDQGRHTWTIDGYKAEEVVIYHLEQLGINLAWVVTGYDFDHYRYYCHFNWGEYGYYNGYFLSGVFNAGSFGNFSQEVEILPIYRN